MWTLLYGIVSFAGLESSTVDIHRTSDVSSPPMYGSKIQLSMSKNMKSQITGSETCPASIIVRDVLPLPACNDDWLEIEWFIDKFSRSKMAFYNMGSFE